MRAWGLVHDILPVGFAVLGVVAMTYQFAKLNGSETFSQGNFFSFFTIQSNVFAAAMLVMTALVRRGERSLLFDAVRGAATFYITITFVVFAVFLSGLQEDLDTHVVLANGVAFTLSFAVAAALFAWLTDRRSRARRVPALEPG